jgi:hypothetical protein
VLSAATISPLVCFVQLFILYVAVCYLYVCVCPLYLFVGCLVVNSSQSDILQTGTSGTHTHIHTHTQTTYSYIPDKQLDEANKRRRSSGTKHKRRPPEDGQTVVTETCRVLKM